MRKFQLFFVLILSTLLLVSCENILNEEDTLELDSVVEEQAAFGWEVGRMVSSSSEIAGLTQNSMYMDEEAPEIPGVASLKNKAERLAREYKANLPATMPLMKVTGDSLLYFEEKFVGERGTRSAFYYDFETGKGRVYEVVFQFASWRNIQYDSSEIKADLNFTLDNPFDDVLESFYNIQLFKDTHFVQRIESVVEITDYIDSEVRGVKAVKDAYYHPDRFLTHLKQTVELKVDESGTLREDFTYRDDKTAYNSVTFKSDNTGSFTKKRRDETLIYGEFDSVEDDLHGYYSETIDFPAGRFVDKIMKSAEVSLTLPDSVFNADFREYVHFNSGRVDTSTVAIQVDELGGVKTTILNIRKPNGGNGQLEIVETESETALNGQWTTWNDYYIIVTAEYYFDGSAHIHYEVYAPPYTEGDNPIVVADYYISPDQSGTGNLSHNGNSYDLNFEESGQATISLDGQSKTINMFE